MSQDNGMKHPINCFFAGAALCLMITPLYAQQSESGSHWVSEELSTYVRSGPTDGYRIVGTLTAGEPVTVLETSGDYSRVESASGDRVWVLSNEPQQRQSAGERVPQPEGQDAELEAEGGGINNKREGRATWQAATLQGRERHD